MIIGRNRKGLEREKTVGGLRLRSGRADQAMEAIESLADPGIGSARFEAAIGASGRGSSQLFDPAGNIAIIRLCASNLAVDR